jgi:WD40 repeat protein
MSGFGGNYSGSSNNNNYNSGGGRGSGRGGGGSSGRYSNSSSNYRGGRGRSSGRYNNNNSHSRGSGGGGRGGHVNYGPAKFKPCKDYTTKGSCNNSNCNYAHVVQLHGTVNATSPKKDTEQANNNNGYSNSSNNNTTAAAVTSVSIWENSGVIKIFTGSDDGFWRLWNTAGGNFVKEFESPMNGPVSVVQVVNNFLFCGFEAVSRALPDTSVGMVHVWNLQNPSQPPLELHMAPLLPYAHNQAVTALTITTDAGPPKVVSGSRDGSIRVWTFRDNAFVLESDIPGHAREITGLVLLPANNLLWSCAIDGAIRIWDVSQPAKATCQYAITAAPSPPTNPPAPGGAAPSAGHGHTAAVTSLVNFSSPAGAFILSSSLDGTIKAWNGTTGECVASETNGEGVVTMVVAQDAQGNQVLLIGTESGSILCRNLVQTPKAPAFSLLFIMTSFFSAGHQGAVKAITAGPAATFYTGGADGKLLVLQLTGDLQLQ